MLNDLQPPVTDRDHTIGPADAPVTLVEFGDYECPECYKAYFVLRDIRQRMGDELRFVFRNFPLTQIHPHALHAAEAAEAAGEQGSDAFWSMHNTLYEHQQDGPDALTDEALVAYAQWLGLDYQAVEDALANDSQLARVNADYQSGLESGVQGTPTFFINGERYAGPWDEPTLLAALERVAHAHA